MSPRTKSQLEKIRKEKKALISDVALKLFAENGYKGTSIASIAKKAGISKGLIYNYYESKEALLQELMIDGITNLMTLFDSNKDGVVTKDEMVAMIDNSFCKMMENADFYRLFFSILLQPGVTEIFENHFFKSAAPYHQMLLNFYVSQNYPDPEAEVFLLYAILDGVGMHYLFRPDQFPIEKVKKIIVERFLGS